MLEMFPLVGESSHGEMRFLEEKYQNTDTYRLEFGLWIQRPLHSMLATQIPLLWLN